MGDMNDEYLNCFFKESIFWFNFSNFLKWNLQTLKLLNIFVCVDDPLNKIVKTMISNVFFLLNYRYFILKILFGGYKYIELFHKFVCMLLFKIKFK